MTEREPPELIIRVVGLPPAKGGASLLSPLHRHHERVLALLRSTSLVLPPGFIPFREALHLSVTLFTPREAPPGDPTNFIGGIADALQRKPAILALGQLAEVTVYENDLQLRRVEFLQRFGTDFSYEVRIVSLGGVDLAAPRLAGGFVGSAFVVDLVDVDELALTFTNKMRGRGRQPDTEFDLDDLLRWLDVQTDIDEATFGALHSAMSSDPIEAHDVLNTADQLAVALERLFLGERRPEDIEALTKVRRECARFELLDLDSEVDSGLARYLLEPTHLVTLLAPVMRSALRLLMPSVRGKVRVCADGTCARFFVDRTKNYSKTWCSESCANRAKQRTYRERHGFSESAIGYLVD